MRMTKQERAEYVRGWRQRMSAERKQYYLRVSQGGRTKEAHNAQQRVWNALRSGRLIKPSRCEHCGSGERPLDGAHHDYSLPLAVTWLCRPCHLKYDRKPKGGYVPLAQRVTCA